MPRSATPWNFCRAWTPPPSPVRYPPHAHEGVELVLVIQGQCLFDGPEEGIAVGSGDLVWIPPRCMHTLREPSRDFRLHVANLPAAGVTTPRTWHGHAQPDRQRQMDVLFGLVRDIPDLPGRRQAAALLLRMAHQVLDHPQQATSHPGLDRAMALLQRDPGAGRALLARTAGVAPATFSRLVSARLGQTMLELRRRARVHRFLEFARHGRGTLLEQALAAGYGSYSQCHRDCLRVTGHPPRVAMGMDDR